MKRCIACGSELATPWSGRVKENDKKRLLDAADAISDAFPWTLASEGFDYWAQIYKRLKNISKGESIHERQRLTELSRE